MFSRKANAQEVDKIFDEEEDCDENLFNFICETFHFRNNKMNLLIFLETFLIHR